MGIDLYLQKGPCKTCGHYESYYDGHYTYNVSPMWHYLFPDDRNMVPIEGMTGKKALKLLNKAKQLFIENKIELVKLNPANGFGSYEEFMDFIDKLIAASEDNPELTWGAWR